MMPSTALEWVTIIASLLALWGWVHARLNSTATENSKKIADLQLGQDDLKQRMQTVESEMHHMPKMDGLHRLELAIMELKTEVTKVSAETAQAARTSARVENYLLEQGYK